MKWPPELVDTFQEKTKHMPKRMQDAAAFFFSTIASRKLGQQDVESVHDLNPNLDWVADAPFSLGHFPCIVCSSHFWLGKSQRSVMGVECLYVQGFSTKTLHKGSMTDTDLQEFAGNAFNGFVVLAVGIGIVKNALPNAVKSERMASIASRAASSGAAQDLDGFVV